MSRHLQHGSPPAPTVADEDRARRPRSSDVSETTTRSPSAQPAARSRPRTRSPRPPAISRFGRHAVLAPRRPCRPPPLSRNGPRGSLQHARLALQHQAHAHALALAQAGRRLAVEHHRAPHLAVPDLGRDGGHPAGIGLALVERSRPACPGPGRSRSSRARRTRPRTPRGSTTVRIGALARHRVAVLHVDGGHHAVEGRHDLEQPSTWRSSLRARPTAGAPPAARRFSTSNSSVSFSSCAVSLRVLQLEPARAAGRPCALLEVHAVEQALRRTAPRRALMRPLGRGQAHGQDVDACCCARCAPGGPRSPARPRSDCSACSVERSCDAAGSSAPGSRRGPAAGPSSTSVPGLDREGRRCPATGLNRVGCSAATMRPWAETSRSRSPRRTLPKLRREASTARSARAQRRMAGQGEREPERAAAPPATSSAIRVRLGRDAAARPACPSPTCRGSRALLQQRGCQASRDGELQFTQ